MLKQLITSSLLLFSLQASANNNVEVEAMADQTIQQLYHSQIINLKSDLSARIETISAQFLGKPYLLGALGEGAQGYYDKTPLYRSDAFDCETYVDTVLALAMADDPTEFKQCIRQIRYQNGWVSFTHRNHFTCLDWNHNNEKQGFIKDITTSLTDNHGLPLAKTAKALIDKPSWYQHFSSSIIRVDNASTIEKNKRLALLKRKGSHLPRTLSTTPYIPLAALFDRSGEAKMSVFNQIPNGAIIKIVRPNWDLQQQIGTRLNVSHLGFAIRKNDQLFFRSASSAKHCVTDESFIDYLRKAQKSPTIKGINIHIVLNENSKKNRCANTHSINKQKKP